MKTFLKYALWVVGFIILSEFLINVGLNSAYKDIKRKDDIAQVGVYQADATLVNGRIRGIIKNQETNNISGKYLKIEFYSKRNVNLGKKYVPIEELETEGTQIFEVFFKLQEVKSYEISIVDEKDPQGEIELIPKEWTRPEILVLTALTLLIFWG